VDSANQLWNRAVRHPRSSGFRSDGCRSPISTRAPTTARAANRRSVTRPARRFPPRSLPGFEQLERTDVLGGLDCRWTAAGSLT
jgi:hypothetical protein